MRRRSPQPFIAAPTIAAIGTHVPERRVARPHLPMDACR